jgi:hypothetical protein
VWWAPPGEAPRQLILAASVVTDGTRLAMSIGIAKLHVLTYGEHRERRCRHGTPSLGAVAPDYRAAGVDARRAEASRRGIGQVGSVEADEDPRAIVKRALGAIGMTLAVIGIVISAATIIGIWIGRGAVNSELAAIVTGLDGRLQRVDVALDALTGRLETAQGRVDQASATATQLGSGAAADGPVVDALRESTDRLVDEYADMRESFVSAREGIMDARDVLDRVRLRFPILPIPQLPGDRLDALDQRLRGLNASLVQLRTELGAREGPVERARDRVVAAINTVSTGIGEVASQVSDVDARVGEARTSLTETLDTAERWVTVAAIVATLLSLYGVLLNLCLFVVGRAWFRRPAAAMLVSA